MATTTATTGLNPAWLPRDTASLLLLPMERMAASMNPSIVTVLRTSSHVVDIPVVTADGSASWYAELDTIAETDPGFGSVSVTPSGLKALVSMSNESLADASPELSQVIGQGLARDMSKKLDAAFVANTTPKGPSGLLSVSGVQTLEAGTAYDGIDWVIEASSMLDAYDAKATGVMVSPATALALGKLKDEANSNRPLLAPSPHDPTILTAAGLPIIVNSQLSGSTSYVVASDRLFTVVRSDVEVSTSDQVLYAKDATMIRAVARFGFGYADPKGIVKVDLSEA